MWGNTARSNGGAVLLGGQTVPEHIGHDERRHDANDLLAMLWTWQHADLSANSTYKGDFAAALKAIKAGALVTPGDTDLYFRVRDNELEVAQMHNAVLRPIPSIWGHVAGLGVHPPDNEFIDARLKELLRAH
jgi:homoserine O-acetyltransferase